MWPIYVINLERAPDRLAAIAADLAALGLPWQRVPARDRLTQDMAAAAADFGAAPGQGAFPAKPGDICCSLTHRDLWRRIAAGDAPGAIVLEDDARLSPAFATLLANDLGAVLARHRMGACKLEYWPGRSKNRTRPVARHLQDWADTTLWRLRSACYGSCAYAITAKAARDILGRWPQMGVPVDHFLFSRFAGRGFRVLRPGFVTPAPAMHDAPRWGSDIRPPETDDPPRQKSRAERWYDRMLRLEMELTGARRVPITFAGDPGRAD